MDTSTVGEMDPVNVKVVYCRICGIKSKKSVKIFSRRGRGMGLENKILKCLMLSVRRSDQLPTRVCFPCIDRLDDFSQFLLHVKQAQVKLRAMLKSQGVHVKEERNIELITTWKALLAHQERESVLAERGRKRKRKVEETIYDSSNSSTSDSVSDDSSSDNGEPDDAYDGYPPAKKTALASGGTSFLDYPFKNEVLDVARVSSDASSHVLQNTVGGVSHSENVSPNLNSDTNTVCSSLPQQPVTQSLNAPSQVSQMQEDEISTPQEHVNVVQGASSSGHQLTTTATDINMTISSPVMFPAQVSSPVIVLPGASLKSPSGGIVPFYIWNMPKGGSPSDVTRRPLPPSKTKKPSCKALLPDKSKVSKEVASGYTHCDLSKAFILPKSAAGNATSPNGTIVVMDVNNANSLPTSVPSQSVHIALRSNEPCVSSLSSEMGQFDQGTSLQETCPIEASVKTNVDVNACPTVSDQGSVFSSQLSNCSEQSSSRSIPLVNSENALQVVNTKNSEVLQESSQLSEPHLSVGKEKKKCGKKSCNKTESVVDKSLSIELPASQEDGCISDNDIMDVDSDSLEPLMLSKEDVISRSDGSKLPRDTQDSLPSDSCLKVCELILSSKKSANPAAMSPAVQPLLLNEPQTVLAKVNSVASEGECDTSCTGGCNQVEQPSVTSAMPVKKTLPLSDLTSGSVAPGLNIEVLSSNTSKCCESSKSTDASRKEKDIEVVDICDIPPLIPISESFLKHYSKVESEDTPENIPNLTKCLTKEQVKEPEKLATDETSQPENSNSDGCVEVGFTSVVKENSEQMASVSGNNAKNIAPPHKFTEWMSAEHVDSDFTVNPDYSVVKCCLCSSGSYPFLITLASVRDHCKFIHPQGIGSFGCIKCDFTTDREQEISQQLQSLHHHASTDCPLPEALDGGSSPQKKPKEGENVVEVKMEPVDVYETALMNLKNSLRKVNMPRFRKLITSFKSSCPDTEQCTPSKVKEEVVESSASPYGDMLILDSSRNRLFTRKGSAYICRICAKKTYSKHQVKMHIARHKPCERERFLHSDLRSETDAPSGDDNRSGKTISSEATSATPGNMVFDIPPIKVEKDDSPQAVEGPSNGDSLRCVSDSLSNLLNVSGNASTSEESRNPVGKSRVVNGGETSKNKTFHSNKKPKSSGVKIPFIKGEPGKLPSAEKVTHKAITSDSFSFTPLPNRSSDGADQGYVSHSRNFRSKPIVKPLYKSPTPKEEPATSPSSGSSSGLHPKVEKPSPSKPKTEEKHSSKSSKKVLVKFHGPSTVQDSPSAESPLKKSTDEGAIIGTASHTPHNPHHLIRQNSSIMNVIRPRPSQEVKRCVKAPTSSSPIGGNPLHQQVDSPSKSQSETMTVNGLVLKVPFIKLQRLNLYNIDPKLGVVKQSYANGSSSENVTKGKGDASSGTEGKDFERSCGSSSKQSTPVKPKNEASDKNEESILGW